VESVRTARGPRQRVVATLGKLPGVDEDERTGWDEIARLLDGRPGIATQPDLFRDTPEAPRWACVNLSGVRVERVREFGKVYVALALWRRLGLHEFFEKHGRRGHEKVDWTTVACILSLGRFCAQGTELALSEHWYAHTALDDLLGVDAAEVYDNRLYLGLDALLPLREELFGPLRERYRTMFGSCFEFLLYDVTSTYFEGQCARNPQAQRGYSRDNRPDCKQVCIGLAQVRQLRGRNCRTWVKGVTMSLPCSSAVVFLLMFGQPSVVYIFGIRGWSSPKPCALRRAD